MNVTTLLAVLTSFERSSDPRRVLSALFILCFIFIASFSSYAQKNEDEPRKVRSESHFHLLERMMWFVLKTYWVVQVITEINFSHSGLITFIN